MTCIVGMIDKKTKKVWLGGDALGSNGWSKACIKDPKVFKLGDMLIGSTTTFRFGQVLQYNFKIPERQKHIDDMQYMVSSVVPELRKALKEAGVSEVNNNVETGGVCLIACNGELYQVQSDFSVLRCSRGFDAIGSGKAFAEGALFAVDGRVSAKEAVKVALQTAESCCATVSGPFTILSI